MTWLGHVSFIDSTITKEYNYNWRWNKNKNEYKVEAAIHEGEGGGVSSLLKKYKQDKNVLKSLPN